MTKNISFFDVDVNEGKTLIFDAVLEDVPRAGEHFKFSHQPLENVFDLTDPSTIAKYKEVESNYAVVLVQREFKVLGYRRNSETINVWLKRIKHPAYYVANLAMGETG